ncbi:MAG TPA: NrtA/SsuA/CpmA family ABC transporter substrate-binding protein [Anaerovoracaceae bacterium]|nr:NrtA/SsuA/CpmA family ABC transporter substrate-binding protein [Anaerovoracaceae bacterium]
MKKMLSIILAVAMIFLLSACGENQNSNGDYTVDTVTMTYVKAPLNVPSIVEKARGDFESAYSDMGLGFAYSELTSGADQTAALASGDIQILNAVGSASVILSAANGADIKIISMYSTSPKAFQLYSADDSISSPMDLRGKTIAGPKGTILHELLVSYLGTADMNIEDVDFISMDIPSAFAALESGSIDCALQAGADAYNCFEAGYHLVTDGQGLTDGTILTATTRDFYDKNKDIIDTFLSVQQDILDFIEQNKDEAVSMAAEATGLEEKIVEEMFTYYDFRMNVTDEDIVSMQNTADFMLSSGLIENAVDVTDLLLSR